MDLAICLLKQESIIACEEIFSQKIQALTNILLDLNTSTNNESKSSAGDKHETSRAMMQIEQEKISKQLLELKNQYDAFHKIDFTKKNKTIGVGSFIQTDKGFFLIASSLGKIVLQKNFVFLISLQSPIGNAFKGLVKNETLTFNGSKYHITDFE